ncbi:MAG: hypothetical protein WCF52_06500, partial [Pseudolabrys sp.]
MKLPTLSVAARLYAIFALMAATTVALSVYAVSNARFHAALTEEFESANAGSWNVAIGIFQTAMRKNVELNRTVLNDADLR